MLNLDRIGGDTRLAFKLLTKHTFLKVAVIATLALGIGANTAMFTVLDALLFPNLPYAHSKNLVIFQSRLKNGQLLEATSYPRFRDWKTSARSFEEIAGESSQNVILSGLGAAEPLKAELVSAEYFSALRTNAAKGRTFTREETSSSAANPVAILSDGLWKRRFGGDEEIIGKTIHLNGQGFTVIGVLPHGFQGISQKAEVWIPITMIGVVSTPLLLENRVAIWVTVIGRVNSGTSLETAQQELSAIADNDAGPVNDKNSSTIQLSPLESRGLEQYKKEAYVLLGSVIFVLLIASLNVANLLLSYFSDRKSELAIRNALGAPPSRLFQQLVTESIVLSIIGGALGLILAITVVRSLGHSISAVLAGIGPLTINGRVFLITAVVSILTGIFSGSIPLVQVINKGMGDHLNSQARAGTGLARTRLRTVLVIGQIGLAVVLVVGAGLMLQSILRLRNVDLGFRADQVLIARLSALPTGRYDTTTKMKNFYEGVLDKVSDLPDVRSAGFSSSPPLLAPSPSVPFLVRGRADMSPNHPPTAQYVVVSRGYFSALSIPLLQGRGIEKGDSETSQSVVVINEAMAKQYWPGQSPIGQYLDIFDGAEAPKQIIGVVTNVRDSSVDTASVPEMYVPYTQVPTGFISLLKSFPPALAVRSSSSPQALGNAIRNIVADIDPNEAVLSATALETVVSESVAQPRLYSQVLGFFAAIALALAALGIYGVVSYSVTQRTQELGVRMALGATRGKILFLVLGQSLITILIGVVLGTCGALALSEVLRSLLFEIRPHDPVTIFFAALLLSIIAMIAAYVPARRASRIDPSNALRM